MTIRVIRAGEHVQHIPGCGMTVRESGVAVAANWWEVAGKTCVAAYQPKGAASLAASYVNLQNPGTYDCLANVDPALGADGWVFNNSANLNTQIPVPDWRAEQVWSALARFSNASKGTTTNAVFGMITSASPYDGFYAAAKDYGSARAPVGYGQSIAVSATQLASGVIGFAGPTAYLDGVAKGAMALGTQGPYTNHRIVIGGVSNNNPTVAELWSRFIGKIQAIAFYSDTLTEAEVVALTARMAAL